MTNNQSISERAKPVVRVLDQFARRADVAAALAQAQAEARARLLGEPGLAEFSVALDLTQLVSAVPDTVGSIRVAVYRGAGGSSEERHPNSTQYLMVLDAPVETHVELAHGWHIDRYGHGAGTTLEDRWHVVEPGTWHKTIGANGGMWSIVAFHSAPDVADEYR